MFKVRGEERRGIVGFQRLLRLRFERGWYRMKVVVYTRSQHTSKKVVSSMFHSHREEA